MKMNNQEWIAFFSTCNKVLGKGESKSHLSQSWCSWTTFARLNEDAGYWTSGLPNSNELQEEYLKDSGTWGQPFSYNEIAHIIVPRKFFWEDFSKKSYNSGIKEQDIDALSTELNKINIKHILGKYALEIKLY